MNPDASARSFFELNFLGLLSSRLAVKSLAGEGLKNKKTKSPTVSLSDLSTFRVSWHFSAFPVSATFRIFETLRRFVFLGMFRRFDFSTDGLVVTVQLFNILTVRRFNILTCPRFELLGIASFRCLNFSTLTVLFCSVLCFDFSACSFSSRFRDLTLSANPT